MLKNMPECENCGAKMEWDVKKECYICLYCGFSTNQEINNDPEYVG